MTNPTPESPTPKATRVEFDLAEVLSPEELEKFQQAAKEAGAASLTEHFLAITLRVPQRAA